MTSSVLQISQDGNSLVEICTTKIPNRVTHPLLDLKAADQGSDTFFSPILALLKPFDCCQETSKLRPQRALCKSGSRCPFFAPN